MTEEELLKKLKIIQDQRKKQKEIDWTHKVDNLYNYFKDAEYILYAINNCDESNIYQRFEICKVSVVKTKYTNSTYPISISCDAWIISENDTSLDFYHFEDHYLSIGELEKDNYKIINKDQFDFYYKQWVDLKQLISNSLNTLLNDY